MDQPGVSFSPFNQRPGQASPGAVQSPVQDAIKIISFRMPSTVGASAPAPASLLGGPTPQGPGLGGGLMQEFLKRLLLGQQPQGAAPMATATPATPAMPTPMGGLSTGQASPFSAVPAVPAVPSAPPAMPDTSSPLPASVQFKEQPTGRMPSPAPDSLGSGDWGSRSDQPFSY